MRDLAYLEKYRVKTPFAQDAYKVPVGKRMFFVIVSTDNDRSGHAIEHVSVSHRNEKIMPSWDEMCAIKDMFFEKEEECVQIHPKHSEYVNMVSNCLHIWHPVNGEIFGWRD